MNIRDILELAPILPLVRIDEPSQAVPLAQALCRAGLRAVEIRSDLGTARGCRSGQSFPGAIRRRT
jgi:2-dehydro-3-deoxyphosphogluconate aldolase / (4S)-4-hydroxy-2-oxoglutarate aldolase